MFENLLVVAIISMVLWLASYGIYLYTSRQQQDIEQDIETVEKMLEPSRREES